MTSVVLLAKDMNLSILKPAWLHRNQILLDEEIQPEFVFTPAVVQLQTHRFEFLALPDRVQLKAERPANLDTKDILRVVGGFARVLPHTPYVACGINFEYLFQPRPEIGEWSRRTLSSPATVALVPPSNGPPRCGAWFSYEHSGFEVRVDIRVAKMVQARPEASLEEGAEVVRAHFNFQSPLSNADTDAIVSVLGKYEETAALAESMAAKLEALNG